MMKLKWQPHHDLAVLDALSLMHLYHVYLHLASEQLLSKPLGNLSMNCSVSSSLSAISPLGNLIICMLCHALQQLRI